MGAVMEIWKEFTFDAAHQLPKVPEGHKCGRLHGHTYRVRIHVQGELNEMGWIMDFADIAKAWKPVHEQVDHRFLNELVPNPTAENLVVWLWARLVDRVPGLSAIELLESSTTGCRYEG